MVNKELGFVYLAKLINIYYVNQGESFFLVSDPKIFIQNNLDYKYIDYRSYFDPNEKQYKRNRVALDNLKLLEKKRNYATYEITSSDLISLDSIKLINPNNPVEFNYQDKMNVTEKAYTDNLYLNWKDGFSGLEGNSENNWRWATDKNELSVINLGSDVKTIKITMSISSGYQETSNLNIKDQISNQVENLEISIIPITYEKIIYLNPGINKFDFNSDSKKIINLNDPRDLRFKIINFKIESIN